MSGNPILPTTAAVEDLCKELDAAVGLFLNARSTLPPLGTYEADIEALNLFYLAIRDIEGVIALARADLVLLPAAFAVSRAAFEIAVRAAWLVDSDDPYGREVRWLAHLRSEERYSQRVADRLEAIGSDAQALRLRAESLRSFRQQVVRALPPGYGELPGNTSMNDMLRALGGNRLYSLYIHMSQFVHGEHAATWLYRAGGLGTKKELGEFIRPRDWSSPLQLSWLSLLHPGQILLDRLGGAAEMFATNDLQARLNAAIERVASADES